jgi:oxygen-dependent protoporphyrinogen oxidase
LTAAGSVVVIGGGISGLTTAYRLVRAAAEGRAPDVTVLEAEATAGGKLCPVEVGDVELEGGADSFVVRKPAAVDLCTELGLGQDLVVPATRTAFVWTGGRLVPFPTPTAFGVPASVRGLLRWRALSVKARARALTDLVRRARAGGDDESLGSLVGRRLGPEAVRVVVGPLLAGVHAGDPNRLSVRATFPELALWEERRESLLRGARAARRAAEKGSAMPIFATVWGGLGRLTEGLVDAIGKQRIRTGGAAEWIRRDGHGFVVGHDGESVRGDAIVVATPGFAAARLLGEVAPDAAVELDAIPYASTGVVVLAYPDGTGGRLPHGTGFVVPLGERTMTACTWVSRKWPREEFGDRAIVRCFVGRAWAEDPLRMSDEELIGSVAAEVEEATPLGASPVSARVVRWERSMPQYEVGHLDRLERIERALAGASGVFVTGSAYRGVGIADCVAQGAATAARVLAHLDGDRRRVQGHSGSAPIKREAISWTS